MPLTLRGLAGSLAILVAASATLVAARADAPTQDAQAAALLAKHRAFVGWQFGDGTFTSMRVTGNVTDEKGNVTSTFVMLSKGLVYRNSYTAVELANLTTQAGFTGNLFWHADINGFTTPVYGGYAKYLASFTVLQQEGTTELPASFRGEKTVDGKAVDVVRVTLANGDPIDCYIDPQTGAYVQATIDPDGSYETTIHVLSYRQAAPGKKMIAAYRIGNSNDSFNYSAFEPNLTVSSDDLHPPLPTASWTFGSQTAFPITLTRNRFLVDVAINGVQGRFILDTGATAIVLDDQFADRVKVPVLKGSGEAATMYGRVKTHARRVDTLGFGNSTLHNVVVYSEDFRNHDFRGLDRQGYDGLVGFDFFAGAIVKLDVYDSKITLLDPSADLSGVGGLGLLVDLSEGVPAIPMTLNKTIEVNALLDTGNPGVVFMSLNLARKHRLSIWTRGCGNLESLTIGPITYAGQEVCLFGFPSNYMLLGFDFLKHFDYVFDYPQGRMFMTPNKN